MQTRAHCTRQTKGSHLSARYLPPPRVADPKPTRISSETNLYTLLGVDSWASQEDLKICFRQRALEEHPDKGGDQARFELLKDAYDVLADVQKREDYDEQLAKLQSRVRVEGRPGEKQGAASKAAEAAARQKTAPRQGSTRQKDWHKQAVEWEGQFKGAAALSHIRAAIKDADPGDQPDGLVAEEDAAQPDRPVAKADLAQADRFVVKEDVAQPDKPLAKTKEIEALYKKLIEVPAAGRKKWLESVRGPQKQALKVFAKAQEAKDMEQKQRWLKK